MSININYHFIIYLCLFFERLIFPIETEIFKNT